MFLLTHLLKRDLFFLIRQLTEKMFFFKSFFFKSLVLLNSRSTLIKFIVKYYVGTCNRPCGATVARLTPDQKVACSNHVGVKMIE